MGNPNRDQHAGRLAGRPVHRIGYGAMQLAGLGGRPGPSESTAVDVLRSAVEQGVDHIDTAEFYGGGLVNTLIRTALHPYPDHLLLVSKVGAEHGAAGLTPAQRPEQLRAAVEANLRSLDVEQLAVVNLRRVDGPPGLTATGDQLVDLDSQLAELAWLLAHDPHVLLIPGTANAAHLAQNLAAADVPLDADTMAVLDALAPAA